MSNFIFFEDKDGNKYMKVGKTTYFLKKKEKSPLKDTIEYLAAKYFSHYKLVFLGSSNVFQIFIREEDILYKEMFEAAIAGFNARLRYDFIYE
jgi:hypothetical protein